MGLHRALLRALVPRPAVQSVELPLHALLVELPSLPRVLARHLGQWPVGQVMQWLE